MINIDINTVVKDALGRTLRSRAFQKMVTSAVDDAIVEARAQLESHVANAVEKAASEITIS